MGKGASLGAGLAALAAAIMCGGAAPEPQKTDAIPALANANYGWQAMGADFRKPESGPGPVMDEPGHVHVGNNVGGQPSFRVADLSNPILQPWTRDALKTMNDKIAAGGGGFSPQVSCKPLGVPAFLLYPAQPVYFVQTPKEVVMIWPPDHQVRHVYMNAKHSAQVTPSWYGESVGRYENGELVVDTIGLSTKTYVDNFRTPHSDKLHVVERFRINPDGKGMDVDVTVDDPGAFTMPWHAVQKYRKVEAGQMIEESCAENPTNFLNYDIDPVPTADKPDF